MKEKKYFYCIILFINIQNMDYKVSSTKNIQLQSYSTKPSEKIDDNKAKKALKKLRKKLSSLQDNMYAQGKYSVLIMLQGMDTSGKDSLIREVFKDINARGVNVESFKVPTEKELKHDYLWRHYISLPARGKFTIFNRTHYENVLVTRVHPNYILFENLPNIETVEDINEAFWNKRFEQINNFEKHLAENGTIILKFFLHLSKDEQKNRLLRRLKIKEKNWKFSAGDLKERKLWDKYQECYEDVLNRSSKTHAPWHIIPADNKPFARKTVAETILNTLEQLPIKTPELDEKTKANIATYINELEQE
jgi:PPK2 family polyphosphate:nucleotide phosphotransferase